MSFFFNLDEIMTKSQGFSVNSNNNNVEEGTR